MAFEQETSRVPTSLGTISIRLVDKVAPTEQTIAASIEILDAGGNLLKTWNGDLNDVAATGILTALTAQMTALRTQAANELLP